MQEIAYYVLQQHKCNGDVFTDNVSPFFPRAGLSVENCYGIKCLKIYRAPWIGCSTLEQLS